MIYRPISVLFAVAIIALFGTVAKADAPKEVKTEKNKAIVLGNFLNAPKTVVQIPARSPSRDFKENPSHGVVGLQIGIADVAATDACPARKIPSIALFYQPSKDFVGNDLSKSNSHPATLRYPFLASRSWSKNPINQNPQR